MPNQVSCADPSGVVDQRRCGSKPIAIGEATETLRKQPRSVIPTGRRTGRPTVAADVEQLVVRMATENPTWG